MAKEYTKEELWGLYYKLPQPLKDAIFSLETANSISSSCDRNNVEQVPKVAYFVGLVLTGLIPPRDFQQTLEKEVGLKKAAAQSIATELSRFIFYPVKLHLEQLYKTPGTQDTTDKVAIPTPRHSSTETYAAESPSAKPKKQDDYIVRQVSENPPEVEKKPLVEEPKEKSADSYREPID